MGFVGMQPACDPISMAVMCRKIEGRPCEFLTDPPKDGAFEIPHLKPICFGSRKCKGYETKLHSYFGRLMRATGAWANVPLLMGLS